MEHPLQCVFEYAVKLRPESVLDLVYYGATIALIGLALYFTHASEGKGGEQIGRAAGSRARHGAGGDGDASGLADH